MWSLKKPQFPYLQERLVWDNFHNILFAARLSLKIAAVVGNENPRHLHEDVESCFCHSDSDAGGRLTRSEKVHTGLEQKKREKVKENSGT